jgi:HTH-type transcriptional regulator/antitoxin HigA
MTVAEIVKYSIHDIEAPRVISSEAQYDHYVSALERLVMQEEHTKDERQFIELLTTLIEKYDEEHNAIPNASPAEVLATLMEANNLKQKDLIPFIGNESVVSMILHGKRPLTTAHIEKLSKHFKVSPAVFFA